MKIDDANDAVLIHYVVDAATFNHKSPHIDQANKLNLIKRIVGGVINTYFRKKNIRRKVLLTISISATKKSFIGYPGIGELFFLMDAAVNDYLLNTTMLLDPQYQSIGDDSTIQF